MTHRVNVYRRKFGYLIVTNFNLLGSRPVTVYYEDSGTLTELCEATYTDGIVIIHYGSPIYSVMKNHLSMGHAIHVGAPLKPVERVISKGPGEYK